jgi:hypothetical protein
VVVRELDELLDVIIPLLGQLNNLVDILVTGVLILLGRESTADRLRLGHLLGLLHRQVAHASLETESLEETTALKEFATLKRRSSVGVSLGSGLLLLLLILRVRVVVVRVVVVVVVVPVGVVWVPGVQRLVEFTAGKRGGLGRGSDRESGSAGRWRQWARCRVHRGGNSTTSAGVAVVVLVMRRSGAVSRRHLVVVRTVASRVAITVVVRRGATVGAVLAETTVGTTVGVLVLVGSSTSRSRAGARYGRLSEYRRGGDNGRGADSRGADSRGVVTSSGNGNNSAGGGHGNWCVRSTFDEIDPGSSSGESRDGSSGEESNESKGGFGRHVDDLN